jgi:hypothetical protein
VAALGDGIVAGKGALADSIADMSIEYKGVSFATGLKSLKQRILLFFYFIYIHIYDG